MSLIDTSETPEATGTAGTPPDVSVVIAVYNTMPYLTRCLDSLLAQTIGPERLEIVAVDDGSTDGSDRELSRFAADYPGSFRVIRQPNSGGPAAPQNRGLEVSTGRFVFFLGSDDYLGPEALERLVRMADEADSDVVLGKMVGVGGRNVPQAVFARTAKEIPLVGAGLPWSLSNTKLFRRDLVERHHLRFPEDSMVYEDQPFTIEACFRARRVSVVGDYDCYYAVRRADEQNVTLRSTLVQQAHGIGRVLDTTVRFTRPGSIRDAFHRRHFMWEIAPLLRSGFLDLDDDDQRAIATRIRELLDEHVSPELMARFEVGTRVPLQLARAGDLETLRQYIAAADRAGQVPVTLRHDRAYAHGAELHAVRGLLPPESFDATAETRTWFRKQRFTVQPVGWHGSGPSTSLAVSIHGSDPALAGLDPSVLQFSARERRSGTVVPGTVTLRPDEAGEGTLIEARLPIRALVRDGRLLRETWELRLVAAAAGEVLQVPLPAGTSLEPRRLNRRGHRRTIGQLPGRDGGLRLSVGPIQAHRAAVRRLRRLLRRR